MRDIQQLFKITATSPPPPISLEKGIRQGGPASSLYFLIVAETLAIELHNNKHIHGICIDESIREYLLGQFADDMDIYLLAQEHNLRTVFNVLEKF